LAEHLQKKINNKLKKMNKKTGFGIIFNDFSSHDKIQKALLEDGYRWRPEIAAENNCFSNDFIELDIDITSLDSDNDALFFFYIDNEERFKIIRGETRQSASLVKKYGLMIHESYFSLRGLIKEKAKAKVKVKTKKKKKKKTKTKTIGAVRIFRKDNLYLYLKLPKELENYFAEHLPERESNSWKVKKGKRQEKAIFYCYSNDTTSDFSPFVKIEKKDNKGKKTKADSEKTESNLDYVIKNNPQITQHYLSNNFGANSLFLADNNSYNIAPLRTKGTSKGITLLCDGLLPPESATEYISVLGNTIKGLYTMLIAKTDIRAKILLDLEL
jgi:hypothetical protein